MYSTWKACPQMCYPKPGPRCSAHARERLNATQNALFAAKTTHTRLSEAHNPVYAEPGDAQKIDAAAARVQEARSEWEAARREWLTTPEGIASIEAEIVSGWQQPHPDTAALAEMEFRKREAMDARARQLGDYHATLHPVAGMSNTALKFEMYQITQERLPQAGDDRAAIHAEMSRYNTVMDEISLRQANGTWHNGTDVPPPRQPLTDGALALAGRLGDIPTDDTGHAGHTSERLEDRLAGRR